jgi:hypothetical protein
MEFEWDNRKGEENARKHDVTFQEAASIFGDPLERKRGRIYFFESAPFFLEHPILYFQIRHALELSLIVRHEYGIKEYSM